MDLPYHPIISIISIFRQEVAFKKSYALMKAYLFFIDNLFLLDVDILNTDAFMLCTTNGRFLNLFIEWLVSIAFSYNIWTERLLLFKMYLSLSDLTD